MDYEDVINMNLTYLNSTVDFNEDFYDELVHEILFGFCCAIAFFADIFIIYTIVYFKRLRTTSNIFIVNWAILDILTLLVAPSGYRLISIIEHWSLTRYFLCCLFQLGSALHHCQIFFVFIVIINWTFAAYFPKLSRKIKQYYKFLIGFSWLLTLILSVVYVCRCHTLYYFYSENFMVILVSFIIMIIYVVTMHCIKAIQKCKHRPLEYPTLSLNLGTGYVCCHILGFTNIIVVEYFHLYNALNATIGTCAFFCNAVLNFIILYNCDNNFKVYFLRILKCKSKQYQDQVNEEEIEGNDFMAQVSFHSPTEELVKNEY